ncbi:hypothetical protein ABKA04_002144 [Annulohypoxylon sp. FPYF3050]
MSSTNATSVTLTGPGQWESWDNTFRAKADSLSIWKKIHGPPEEGEYDAQDYEWLTKPRKPDLAEYRPANAANANRGANGMTATQMQAYTLDFNIYKDSIREYDAEKSGIEKLKSWVHQTVSSHYLDAACKPEQNLGTWYLQLKEFVGINEAQLRIAARDEYYEAIKPLTRPPKNWNSWVLQWEKAMSKAQGKNISSVKNSAEWFDDLIKAIGSQIPDWTVSYRIMHEKDIDDNLANFRDVANSLRTKIRTLASQRQTRVGRGAFGPTYEDNDDDDDEPSNKPKGGRGNKRGRGNGGNNNPNKKSKPDDNQEDTPKCGACQGVHKLSNCWFVFENKRPEYFNPHEKTLQRIENHLKQHPEVQREIDEIKKPKRGKKKPAAMQAGVPGVPDRKIDEVDDDEES